MSIAKANRTTFSHKLAFSIFQIKFGYEDDYDAIFYKLNCGHIIELTALRKMYNSEENNIKIFTCMYCSKPLFSENCNEFGR